MPVTNGLASARIASIRLDTYRNPAGAAVETALSEHDIPYDDGVCGMVGRDGQRIDEPGLSVAFENGGRITYRGRAEIEAALPALAENEYASH